MMMWIGAGVAAVVVVGYLGRKGWHALHRAVGITPGTMVYVDHPAELPPPPMLQLNLSPTQMQQLPPAIIEQLSRIDNKAAIYQTHQPSQLPMTHGQLRQTPVVSEEAFIVHKLLNERLPEMIDSYQRLAQQQQQLNMVATDVTDVTCPNVTHPDPSQPDPSQPDPADLNHPNFASSDTCDSTKLDESTALLLELLQQTETKLDGLLAAHQTASLQEMQVLHRYLKDR